LFFTDCHDLYLASILIDIVEDTKTIVRTEANLPLSCERGRLVQWSAVLGFDPRIELQLLVNSLIDQAVVLCLN